MAGLRLRCPHREFSEEPAIRAISVIPPWFDRGVFDVGDHLDGLRAHSTGWLRARRDELVREQRRLRVEELAVVRVLDERRALDPGLAGRDGVSERSVRETVETARALESLPAVAAVAHAGELSSEQLGAVTQLADEVSDAEWAARAPHTAPADLARMVRTQRKPTAAESRARREARHLRMWWDKDQGLLQLRGALADVDGARFEAVIQRMTDKMRPAKGQSWARWEHRAADALVTLAEKYETVEVPAGAPSPLLVVEIPPEGPATVAGIPLPDALVEQLRANARIEAVLVTEPGETFGKRTAALSPKVTRAVLLRDGHCRIPGCERRHGLEVHHLQPRSWGGSDDIANLAAVCRGAHHQMLIPHGPWVLVGNPYQPDGLRLKRIDELTADERDQLGLPPARAGPAAA
jgi:hypothetical protein